MREKNMFKKVRALLVIMVLWCGLSIGTLSVQAATDANKEACKKELAEMLYSADSSTHNLYKYRLTADEFYEIVDSLKYGDCRLIWASYYSNMFFNADTKFHLVNNVNIANIDDNVLQRYEVLTKNVEKIRAGLKDGMTDLDKIIYFHNCLVEIVSYRYVGYQSYGACGALGENTAVCSGYTKALNMLLDMEGIETRYISSITLDHGWTLVKLDNEWYHIDATWDDTRSAIKGQVGHQFLLQNDSEFSGWKSHVDWNDPGEIYHSTSTRFSDWYVHDITGKMLYEDGYWYYVDNQTNTLKKATADGSDMHTLIDGSQNSTIELISVENGVITYHLDGVTLQTSTSENVAASENGLQNSEASAPPVADTSVPETIIDIPYIEDCDFAAQDSWQSGYYNFTSASYTENYYRICLTGYMTYKLNDSFTVICPEGFEFVIREMNSEKSVINTRTLTNGMTYNPNVKVAYLAVSVTPNNGTKPDFAAYQKMISKGMFNLISALAPNDSQTNEDTEEPFVEYISTDLENCNLSDITNWQPGYYNFTEAAYVNSYYRICLTEYKTFRKGHSFMIVCPSGLEIDIREMNSNHEVINTRLLRNGDVYSPKDNVTYLAIFVTPYDGTKPALSTYQHLITTQQIDFIVQ